MNLHNIIAKLNKLAFPAKDEALREAFIEEITAIYNHHNPDIDPALKYVWVMSARHSYRKEAITMSPQNIGAYDADDTFNRINLGITIAREVAALRLNKQLSTLTNDDLLVHGPKIIYNGEQENNAILHDALQQGEITNYPKEQFVIFDVQKNRSNSQGQFESLQRESELGKVTLKNSAIAIITHAYHWPRTARISGDVAGFDYFPYTKIIAYLVDRQFKAPGAMEELEHEVLKLPGYVEKGFILSKINKNIQYNGAALPNLTSSPPLQPLKSPTRF